MSIKANRIERYYDTHTRDDEELTQGFFHQAVIEYLMEILKWLFYGQNVGFATNVNFYVTPDPREAGVSPDIAVVDGLRILDREEEEANSYYVGEDGPAPRVIFEISSKDTWMIDLNQKPARYAAMGVAEYFAFDPHRRGTWTRNWRTKNRLVGWRLDQNGQYQEIAKREDGWLWSEQLQSWLVVEGAHVRLYTAEGELRINQAEAAQRRANQEQHRADQERQRAEELAREVEQLREQLRRQQDQGQS